MNISSLTTQNNYYASGDQNINNHFYGDSNNNSTWNKDNLKVVIKKLEDLLSKPRNNFYSLQYDLAEQMATLGKQGLKLWMAQKISDCDPAENLYEIIQASLPSNATYKEIAWEFIQRVSSAKSHLTSNEVANYIKQELIPFLEKELAKFDPFTTLKSVSSKDKDQQIEKLEEKANELATPFICITRYQELDKERRGYYSIEVNKAGKCRGKYIPKTKYFPLEENKAQEKREELARLVKIIQEHHEEINRQKNNKNLWNPTQKEQSELAEKTRSCTSNGYKAW